MRKLSDGRKDRRADGQTDRQTVERPIKIIEESSNNHTLETAVCKWSTKQVLSKMLQNSTEKLRAGDKTPTSIVNGLAFFIAPLITKSKLFVLFTQCALIISNVGSCGDGLRKKLKTKRDKDLGSKPSR